MGFGNKPFVLTSNNTVFNCRYKLVSGDTLPVPCTIQLCSASKSDAFDFSYRLYLIYMGIHNILGGIATGNERIHEKFEKS